MRSVKIAAVQMKCANDREENIENAIRLVKSAAEKGANVVLLPELFERPYFCQERNYDYYSYAEEPRANAAIRALMPVSKDMKLVIPVSFYEKCGNLLFNSVEIIDCGKLKGIYRKTHIPDDHYYQEKFYFTNGNTGYKVFDTKFGRIGVGICWDQWFPETARALALNGAEMLLFPTAIGTEPILGTDSMGHWQRVMCGHAAANLMPVAAANRIGTESVIPSEANGGQSSSLTFYGSSFIADATGEISESLGREEEGIICAAFDLDELQKNRYEWGLFRDRRPLMYKDLVKK